MNEERTLQANIIPVLEDSTEFTNSLAEMVSEAMEGLTLSADIEVSTRVAEESVERLARALDACFESVTSELQTVTSALEGARNTVSEMLRTLDSLSGSSRGTSVTTDTVTVTAEGHGLEVVNKEGEVVETTITDSEYFSNLSSATRSALSGTISVTDDALTEVVTGLGTAVSGIGASVSDTFTVSAVEGGIQVTNTADGFLNVRFDPEAYEALTSTVSNVSEALDGLAEVTAEGADATTSKEQTADRPAESEKKTEEKRKEYAKIVTDALSAVGLNRVSDTLSGFSDGLKDIRTSFQDVSTKSGLEREKALGDLYGNVMQFGFKTLFDVTKTGVDAFLSLWKAFKDSSPILKNMLDLFSTVYSLIFMPIGNKIGEMLIPKVLEIYDSLDEMWEMLDEAYNEGGIGGMIEVALHLALDILFDELHALTSTLIDSNTPWLRSLGLLLESLATLAESVMFPMLDAILGVTTFVLENIRAITSTLGGVFAYMKTQQLVHYNRVNSGINRAVSTLSQINRNISTQTGRVITAMATTASKLGTNLKLFLARQAMLEGATKGVQTSAIGEMIASTASVFSPGAILSMGIGLAASAAISALMGSIGLKSGGYVPAREGGELHILAEGGEGEFVVPESKAEKFAEDYGKRNTTNNNQRSNSYNITINGYTDSQLREYVTDLIDERASLSRIRAGI